MKRFYFGIRLIFGAGLLNVIFLTAAYGQLGRGSVTGSVTDQSGATVPGASVTLTNQATGIQRTGQTSTDGLYRVDFIQVGTYTLRVSAQGFANVDVKNLVVTVGEIVTRNVKLEVAPATQTVTVESGGVQLVQTQDAEISGLLSRTAIQDLPLEIRDTTAFVNLMPGAVPDVFNGSTRGAAVNGMRGGMGNFLLDGTDNNDYGQGGRSKNTIGSLPGGLVSVSPDAVQEFRVVTNNYSAEYGRQGGFVTDLVLKSGTNQFHGSAFEYNRNSNTTANDFFSNRAGNHDVLIRNQFGGSLGGPIKKDKMFLFGAVELQRLRQTVPITATGIRQDFVNFVDSGGFASFVNSNPSAFFLSAPIDCSNPGNPGCTLGPIFKQLDGKWPLPRTTAPPAPADYVSSSPIFGGITYPVPVFGLTTYAARNTLNEDRINFRYDYNISAQDTLTAHYAYDNYPSFFGGQGGDFYNPGFSSLAPARAQNAALGWTHVFSPTIVNEAKFSYLRDNAGFPAQDPQIPSIGAIDALGFGFGSSSALPQNFTENTFQWQDNLSLTKGRHTFKVGGDYRRTRNVSFFGADFDGLYELWDTENLLTDGAIGDLAQAGMFYAAEAALNPSSPTPALPDSYRGFRANELSGYVEDNWKASNRVTLTLGLRYDYFGVPHNFRPNIDSNFFFGSPNLNQCIIRNATGKQVCFPIPGAANPVSTNPYYPVNSYTAAEFGGFFQVRNNEIWNKDTNNFAPRFGLAWDVRGNQRTVVRMGGGIFYDRMWNNLFENIRFNPPYYAFEQFGYVANNTQGPFSTPGFYSVPINLANFAGPGASPSPRHMDQNLVTAYSEQTNFDIQQQLGQSWLLDLAYIGTFGHKLTGVVDLNTFPGRVLFDAATGGYFYSTRRINPNIGADNARGNFYNSNYNALQVRMTKRMSHGLMLDTNYTWSHALDFVSDAFNNKAGGDYHPEDTFNRNLEYGNADFDLRHRFVSDFVWDLPIFKSHHYLGGWSLNGIWEWQSGSPFTIFDSSVDSNGDGHYNDRGVFLGRGDISTAVDRKRSPADGYLYTNLFAPTPQPAPNIPAEGMLARNSIFGPSYFNTDLSISKKFRFGERLALTAMVSAFNVWNHQNFIMQATQGSSSAGDISNSSFGQATTTVQPNNSGSGGRVMQFALRLDF